MAVFREWFAKKMASDKFIAVVLAVACFFVYADSLNNAFVWDDEEQVMNNAVIRDWDNVGSIWRSSTFYAGGAGLTGGFYRPLVTLSYFWNYAYWGLNPFGYHLMQLLFHCANAFLVFYLLKIIFEKQKIPHGRTAAFFAALIFAVHPANVESVAYIGSIGEVVYSFMVLAGLVLFVRSFDAKGEIVRHRFFWLSFALVFLGLLAKESAVAAVFLFLAYAALLAKPSKKLFLKIGGGFAAAFGAYMFLRLKVAAIAPVSAFYAPIHLAPLWQRLLTVPYEIISYFEIILFPKDLSISRHFVTESAADPRFWGSMIVLALVGMFAAWYFLKTKSKVFTFCCFWFAVTLSPVLNIVPLDMTLAERWLYFPIIGFLGAASCAAAGFFGKLSLPKQKAALALFAVIAVILGARTMVRNADWKNGLTLYGHDIALAQKVSPQGSFDLENNYGVELFRGGRIGEAGEHFKRSIALQSNWATPQNNLGAVLERQGDLEGALKQYRIAADNGYYLAYENIPGILMKLKRYDEAKKSLEESLAIFPKNANLQFKLAYLYAAGNVGNDKDAKQKSLYLLSLILSQDPQNQNAITLYQMLQSGQKIEI